MVFNVPFRAVIFDMDGVLFDSEWYYYHELAVFSDAFDLGVTEEERRHMVGNSSQNFCATIQAWWQRAGHGQIDAEPVRKVYYDWAATRSMDYRELLNPGVPQALDALEAHGVRCALASSSPLESINQALDECGLRRSFETIVSGEQFRESKPNPEILSAYTWGLRAGCAGVLLCGRFALWYRGGLSSRADGNRQARGPFWF